MNTDDQIKLAQAQLIQHTAEQMGIDVNTLSTEDLAKFASHVLAEAGTSQAEQELETKVAEADALGRLMARSFVEEQAKVAQEEMAAQEMPGYGRAALRGAAAGALGGGLLNAGLGAALGHYGPSAGLPGDVYGVGGKGALYGAGVGGGVGAIQGAALGATLGLGRAALQRRAIAAQQAAAAAPVEEKVASAMGDIQNFWAMKIAEEMEEESAAEEAAMENESAKQEAEEEAAAEDEAKEAMYHLAQALHANGRTKTAGVITKALFQPLGTDLTAEHVLRSKGYTPEQAADIVDRGSTGPTLAQGVLGHVGGGLVGGIAAPLALGLTGNPYMGQAASLLGSHATNVAIQSKMLADRLHKQEAAKQAAYEFAKLAEARAAEIMAANGIHPATLEPIAPSNVKIAHVVTPDAVHSYAEKVAAAQFNEQLDSAALHILKSIGFV